MFALHDICLNSPGCVVLFVCLLDIHCIDSKASLSNLVSDAKTAAIVELLW